MDKPVFTGKFTQQSPIPDAGIEAAVDVLRSGRLHRYNTLGDELSDTALLEREYARWQGSDYCLACASGGQAMIIALRAAGVKPGDKVLTNAFTLAPVPGAISATGAAPVLVEITEDLVLDLDDLAAKAATSDARFLLLSHMRGHLVDMTRLMAITNAHNITVIEDCAHTMGATWAGEKSGNFGLAGCFSTQTYKHMNSGEGGLLTSNDPSFMARAIILSGSYMLFARHGTPPAIEHFAEAKLEMPNNSARMDNLRAAILRPQLRGLAQDIDNWNKRYHTVAGKLATCAAAMLPDRPPQGHFVGSSIQWRVPGIDQTGAEGLLRRLASRGVEIKWFGGTEPNGFTSAHQSWHYVAPHQLPATDGILACLFDMRLPLSFSIDDCALIGDILVDEISATNLAI